MDLFSTLASALSEQVFDAYDMIEGVPYAKRGVEPSFLSKQVLNLQKRPTPAELIAKEQQLDLDIKKRRERYAKDEFTVPADIEAWDSYSQTKLPSHIPEAKERAIKLEQKRIAMEQLAAQQEAERQERRKQRNLEKLKRKEEGEEVSDTEEEIQKRKEEEFNKLSEEEKEEFRQRKEKIKAARLERQKRAEEDTQAEKEAKEESKVLYPINQLVNKKIAIWKGDITTLEVDAIVNAANESLLGGGGVDGAIHVAAGPWLYEECFALDGCETGKAKITRGYYLPCKHVIHTVGPKGRFPSDLNDCYINSLNLAVQYNIKTVAFCGISTGIYGYPLYCASRQALESVRKWLETDDNASKIELIIFCVFMFHEMDCYDFLAPFYFPTEHTISGFANTSNATTTTTTATTTTTTTTTITNSTDN